MNLMISDTVRPWLLVQRGGQAALAHDRALWQDAYEKSLLETLALMQPYMPTTCHRFCDIGSGLSAMGMLVRKHYNHAAQATLIDGDDKVARLPKNFNGVGTYSNRRAAQQFWIDNGQRAPLYLTQAEVHKRQAQIGPFDFVYSVGSWCFHYAPDVYLELVRARTKPGSVIITDIRLRQAKWREQMQGAFDLIAEIPIPNAKYCKAVYHVK